MATNRWTSKWSIVLLTTFVVVGTDALYVASCFLPTSTIGEFDGGALADGYQEPVPMVGWDHLVFAFLAIPNSLPPWSANFVLCAGVIYLILGRRERAAKLGITATLLGLTTPLCFFHDHLYIGFYFWQGSLSFFAVGAITIRHLCRPREMTSSEPLH